MQPRLQYLHSKLANFMKFYRQSYPIKVCMQHDRVKIQEPFALQKSCELALAAKENSPRS